MIGRSTPSRVLAVVGALLIGATPALAPPPGGATPEVTATWWDRAPTRRSRAYRVKTDLPLPRARAFGRHLDRMYDEYETRLASLPPRGPEQLDVYIFARQQEYLDTLRTRWGVDGQGTGGMFFVRPEGSGLAFWTEKLPDRRIHHVIQHEGFHQFAYSRFGSDLPLWVNEGLAEFFGEAVLVNDRFVLGQSRPRVLDTVKQALETGEHVPFREMLSMDGAAWGNRVREGGADLQYHQAWSMVHFLVYGDGERYQGPFEQYLGLLNGGTASEPAFAEVFGPDIEAFERSWRGYALGQRPSAFVTALERIEFLAEGALALSRGGTVPESVETLAEALRGIAFRHVVTSHGRHVELSADDAVNFAIPADDLTDTGPPAFVVEKPRLRGLNRRTRTLEETRPTPSAISTMNLRPVELAIDWTRDRTSGELRYEIEVRTSSRPSRRRRSAP